MPTYTTEIPDSVVALITANADALAPYGYNPALPDPVGSFLYQQALVATRSVLQTAAYEKAAAKAQAAIRDQVAAAFAPATSPADPAL